MGDAIRHLTQLLERDLWLDQAHLAGKHGDRVFREAKEAVKKLQELIQSKKSGLPDATLQNLLRRIVQAGHLLAVITIHEVARAGLDHKKLEQALAELVDGDTEAATGRSDEAIEHYRQAWRHAQHLRLQPQRGTSEDDLRLEFLADAGQRYILEASTNLTDWVTLGQTRADADGCVGFEDHVTRPLTARFYRVRRAF
jgi:tetratricopeptide (TPR) repeat protein